MTFYTNIINNMSKISQNYKLKNYLYKIRKKINICDEDNH
jgi:hypothetical protein